MDQPDLRAETFGQLAVRLDRRRACRLRPPRSPGRPSRSRSPRAIARSGAANTSSIRSSGTARVTIGARPGGFWSGAARWRCRHRRRGQAARDRRRGHQQDVDATPLADEVEPLADAEPVLLVDHHQPESRELDALLEQRVGADDEAGAPLASRSADGRRCRPGPCRSAARPHAQRRQQRRKVAAAAGPAPRSAPSAPPARRPRPPAASRPAPPPSCRCRHRPAAAGASARRRPDRARSRRSPSAGRTCRGRAGTSGAGRPDGHRR